MQSVCVGVCICLFSLSVRVFVFALMFPMCVLFVALSRSNKLPNLPTGPEALPFWCLSLFAFILSETYALLSTPLIFLASFLLSLTLPASLCPCEVCDLCNFILPVARDIS